jgi:acetyl esterase/lipase
MNTQVSHLEAVPDFRRSLRLLRGIALLLLLLIAVGCQSGPATPAAASEADSLPAPSATPPPTPTETPEPPPMPTEEAIPEAVTIPYMDPDTDKDIAFLSQWLRIHRPATADTLHPTVFLLSSGCHSPDVYDDLVERLVDRGYAVVAVRARKADSPEPYRSLLGEDFDCAFAWLLDNTAAYDLDPERIFLFGHWYGGYEAAGMPLEDESHWAKEMRDCPYPVPDPSAIKGVITYDAHYAILEGVLSSHASTYAAGWGIPGADMLTSVATLKAVPPQEWPESTLLDDNTRKLAKMLPLYWLHIADSSDAGIPPYLLIYGNVLSPMGHDFATEAETMAENMSVAGIDVTLTLLDNATWADLIDAQTDVPARVAEAVDAFIAEQSQ